MAKSTTSGKSRKAAPKAKFPLWVHGRLGYWCRKATVNGKKKFFYFGKATDDPDGTKALKVYEREWPYLREGRTPPAVNSKEKILSVGDLAEQFDESKKAALDAGELAPRSYRDYVRTCDRLVNFFDGGNRHVHDLKPKDFEKLRAELAKTLGPVALGNEINRVRVVMKYAYDNGLIAEPVKYGTAFKRPSKKVLRKNRADGGKRLFTPAEVRCLLDGKPKPTKRKTAEPEIIAGAKSRQLRAMILLGINCGLGNHDCGRLPIDALDLDGGWLTFPRPKTGVERRAKLWPETVEAIRAALAKRPKPKNPADDSLVFITKYGSAWSDDESGSGAVSLQFGRLLKRLGINGRRGLGFYSLRHTARTIMDRTLDFPAARLVMGHADASDNMDATYVEEIGDDRLEAVAEHVRGWLFPDAGETT
ncbi:MAG: site-specific integrase [Planctomycetales bacterium]